MNSFPTEIAVDPLDDLYVLCQSSLAANASSIMGIFEKHGKLDFTVGNRPQSITVDDSDVVLADVVFGGVNPTAPDFEGLYADSLVNGHPVNLPVH